MPKFSVKKPFTILVMVIVMLMLGVVSVLRMQMDLLPEISLPYIIVITTYPGASPERVESTIAEPMEKSLGTISGVENINSYSYENYCIVQLEFADDTDLDAVLVKVYTSLDTIKSGFPEEVGIPSVLELSTDMLANQYLAVGYEGMNIEELSRFVENTVNPAISRQAGVANVNTSGLISRSVQVELDQTKVDALNAKILGVAEDALEEAREQLDEAKEQLEEGQRTIDENREELENGEKELRDGQRELDNATRELEEQRAELERTQTETYEQLAQASQALDQLSAYQSQLMLQQAELTALDTILAQIREGMAQAAEESGVEASSDTDLMNTMTTLMLMLNSSEDGELNSEERAAVSNAAAMLEASGYDVSALRAANTRSEASAIISGLSDQARVAPVIDPEAGDSDVSTAAALSMLTSYNAEREALVVEMEVTKAIIAGYEQKLAEMGVTYTDIEAAKMQAAASFGFAQAQIAAGATQLEAAKAQLEAAREQIEAGRKALEDGQKQIDDGWEQYYEGLETFETQGEEARRNANADKLLTLQTLAQLIYAQNFEMPAGYLDDEEDNSWLLKIGKNFESVEELEDLVLVNIDKIGDVKLGDVANLTIVDNSDTTYTRLNGEDAVILSVFKSSTAGTNEVSKTVLKEVDRLEKQYPGLSIMVVVDQGDYINLIVGSVAQSMVLGAGLAIVILAIFLRDVLPTLVVAFSIPLSVLAALMTMYFTGISLNMMSLSGMALGIGMLVDNSIVVIENIYRLRGRNVEAPRAAVQGTKQVAGAIIASTLTTVCVFFPMVYTTGMVRELMLPMSLTIIYCLMASLLISMTVVPAAGSTLLRYTKPKEHRFFDKVQDLYARSLSVCLRFKVLPLSVAIGLLALSIYLVVRMGIVLIPEISSNQIQLTMVFDEELPRKDCYEKADEAIERILAIEGVDSVAVMTGGSESLMTSSSSSDNYSTYSFMLTTENKDAGAGEVKAITNALEERLADLGGELTVSTGMSEMTNFLGSGLSLSIYGDDVDTLREISEEVMEVVGQIDGYTEISNGQEDAAQVLHLYVDKNRAMRDGLSVAQIFQELAGKLTTSASAVTVKIDGTDMDLKVVNGLDPLTQENILDYTFPHSVTDEKGNSTTEDVPLSEYADIVVEDGIASIARENQSHYINVTASVAEGYNTTLLTRQLEPKLERLKLPEGYTLDLGGEYETVNQMVSQMALVMLLGLAFVYLVMVAQFQSLLSPFIVLFTVPLAFTGGLLALWGTGENLSIISLMGFLVLLGTVVNNGIVFVDYTNQLRMGGLERHDALIATGKTRMRPILMTALTTILAEASLIFGDDMGSQMGRSMALVIAGGLAYATLMTLYIIPVMYDILFKKQPLNVDTGSENLDDIPDDAGEYLNAKRAKQQEKERELGPEMDTFEEAENPAGTRDLESSAAGDEEKTEV